MFHCVHSGKSKMALKNIIIIVVYMALNIFFQKYQVAGSEAAISEHNQENKTPKFEYFNKPPIRRYRPLPTYRWRCSPRSQQPNQPHKGYVSNCDTSRRYWSSQRVPKAIEDNHPNLPIEAEKPDEKHITSRQQREARPFVDKKTANRPKRETGLTDGQELRSLRGPSSLNSRIMKCLPGRSCPIISRNLLDKKSPNLNAENHKEPLQKDDRIRRSVVDDKGFRDFTPHSNTRGSIYSTRTFGPNSHGGWESTAKLEHDFWKSKDGNHQITGYLKHNRVDGGRFDGFKDNSAGIGYIGRFRRSAFDDKGFRDFTPHTNTRGMLYGTKSFGPNSHGGWQSTGKVEHDFWKSNDGNHRITGFVRHDRIDGGRFDGFKDNRAGIGYIGRFRRSVFYEKGNRNIPPYYTSGILANGRRYSDKSFLPSFFGSAKYIQDIEPDNYETSDY